MLQLYTNTEKQSSSEKVPFPVSSWSEHLDQPQRLFLSSWSWNQTCLIQQDAHDGELDPKPDMHLGSRCHVCTLGLLDISQRRVRPESDGEWAALPAWVSAAVSNVAVMFTLYSLMWYLHLLSNLLLCVCVSVLFYESVCCCTAAWWWQLKSRETVCVKMESEWIMTSARWRIMVWYNVGLASSLVLHKVTSVLF